MEHKTNTMLRSLACFLAFWDDPVWCHAIGMDSLEVLVFFYVKGTYFKVLILFWAPLE